MSWKPVPRFAKCGTSQAPSLHFSFTAWWTGTGILTEVTRKRKPKGKRQLAHDKILVLKYSEEARAWKMHDNKTCPRWYQSVSNVSFYIFFEKNLLERRQHTVSLSSLKITESLTKQIQYISEVPLRGLIFRVQVSTTIWTSSWTRQEFWWRQTRCSLRNETQKILSREKRRQASAYRPERVRFQTPLIGLIFLDSSAASLINRETKVSNRRKVGKFLPSRWMSKTQRNSPFSQRTTEGIQHTHHRLNL